MKYLQIFIIAFYFLNSFGQNSYSDTNNVLAQLKKIEQVNFSISNRLDSCCKRKSHTKRGASTFVYIDSSKYKTITDTIITADNRVIQQTIIESNEQRECEDCFFSICDCKILSDLIWPLTILIIIGIFYWKIRTLLENIGERIKKGDGFKIGKAGIEFERVSENEKAEKEFDLINVDELQNNLNINIEKQDFIPKYLQLERTFFNLLVKFFHREFEIMSNRRIDMFEYDIIMESLNPREMDYIFEIKFYPKGYNRYNLQQAILKLDQSTINYMNKTRRYAKPILFIVVQKHDFSIEKFNEIINFIDKNTKDLKFMTTTAITFEEFDELSKVDILKLMQSNSFNSNLNRPS